VTAQLYTSSRFHVIRECLRRAFLTNCLVAGRVNALNPGTIQAWIPMAPPMVPRGDRR
jgi:hypothetical protein